MVAATIILLVAVIFGKQAGRGVRIGACGLGHLTRQSCSINQGERIHQEHRSGPGHGVGEVISQLGDLLVESRVPRAGAPKSATYTGDGYMTVRHPETRVVEEALRLIAGKLRITDSHPATPADTPESRRERWARDLGYFRERRNNPSWDHGHPPSPSGA
jgi:hypothetical protein